MFTALRAEAQREAPADAAEAEYARALELHASGEIAACIRSLEMVVRAPRLRFAAAAWLGRIHRDGGDTSRAIEWLDRAADAPAPTTLEAYGVLYDLAVLLEGAGEHARALAIYLELRADAGTYRDVDARIERLTEAETRG